MRTTQTAGSNSRLADSGLPLDVWAHLLLDLDGELSKLARWETLRQACSSGRVAADLDVLIADTNTTVDHLREILSAVPGALHLMAA
ncbi:hypothetical protein [Capillimicrobium parvum]|uniref:hypothetical protein n=1 Tax=Capillimicrobium parvum TaxID=2884022 RepID=UPI00216AEFA0|nr:hypothetical protein [Capillimicrobium parvum]